MGGCTGEWGSWDKPSPPLPWSAGARASLPDSSSAAHLAAPPGDNAASLNAGASPLLLLRRAALSLVTTETKGGAVALSPGPAPLPASPPAASCPGASSVSVRGGTLPSSTAGVAVGVAVAVGAAVGVDHGGCCGGVHPTKKPCVLLRPPLRQVVLLPRVAPPARGRHLRRVGRRAADNGV